MFSVFMALAILLAGALAVAPTTDVKAVSDQWELACSESPSGTNNYLFGAAAHADDAVVAVGSKNVSGQYKPLIERWEAADGNNPPCFKEKSGPSVPLNSELYGVARVPTASLSQRPFWAVGYQGATSRVWDEEIGDWVVGGSAQTLIEYSADGGQTWTIVPSPNIPGVPNVLKSVSARSVDDAWAVGYYGTVGTIRTLILRWNGTSWSIVPSPNRLDALDNYLHGVSIVDKDYVWAVGFTRHPTTQYRYRNLILRWNGTLWSEVPSPDPSLYWNYLFAVTGISDVRAHAVGSYLPDLSAKDSQALWWNGTQWLWEQTPSPGAGANVFYGTAHVDANYVWAVGSAEDPPHRTLTARRVNGVWYHVASPNASTGANELRAVTVVPGTSPCAGGNNWAVGYYVNGSAVHTLAMRYHISAVCDLTP
jgi:hypothetical protein